VNRGFHRGVFPLSLRRTGNSGPKPRTHHGRDTRPDQMTTPRKERSVRARPRPELTA
jgi:hypothetical protein